MIINFLNWNPRIQWEHQSWPFLPLLMTVASSIAIVRQRKNDATKARVIVCLFLSFWQYRWREIVCRAGLSFWSSMNVSVNLTFTSWPDFLSRHCFVCFAGLLQSFAMATDVARRLLLLLPLHKMSLIPFQSITETSHKMYINGQKVRCLPHHALHFSSFRKRCF